MYLKKSFESAKLKKFCHKFFQNNLSYSL